MFLPAYRLLPPINERPSRVRPGLSFIGGANRDRTDDLYNAIVDFCLRHDILRYPNQRLRESLIRCNMPF